MDAEDLKADGYDLGSVAACCEYAIMGLSTMKSKEAEVVRNHLATIRDDCEAHWEGE